MILEKKGIISVDGIVLYHDLYENKTSESF